MKTNSKPTLLSKLEALDVINRSLETHSSHSEFLEKVQLYCTSSMAKTRAQKVKQALTEMGLTEFEAIQLLDFNPKSIVCLQLVIEDMEERFTEDALIGILDLFNDNE
ncbi:RNA pol Rpb4 domain-containing protein [Encephalitozoon hellem ATCC 50504]|uniref:RNA polymerase III subunit RPC9 n=1 Tax=Encephalitozoon hellem TaxID=27973 RepID=A0A9Q9CC42_ENCHE|nr:RNA pol Rpb4 domain-containing protein [Encephalitozoon hellem ATCC 50504]AFM98325.1 RNA pol Rpb4 domain-containing protein [Encephalitozoon hellem ATCC 50504]UTX43204.1 RNA polymerase III subunit RPC9 [Encephalitozoon hellem]WEL38661.1 RNA polymerase III subunit RPC9 [Encephalitozoon hellem]|eukprot:XP_003887306.1 RNA pol Rpb4 domain-containing protein [Encephalitozoon hellem ATCC 50504]